MRAWPLERSPQDSRASAARARRVRCDGLEQKIARLWNTSPPHNPAARQVTPSTMNIFESGSRCAAASAAVHGAAAALISPRTPPTRAPPRPHATCALHSRHPPVCAARRSRSHGAGHCGSGGGSAEAAGGDVRCCCRGWWGRAGGRAAAAPCPAASDLRIAQMRPRRWAGSPRGAGRCFDMRGSVGACVCAYVWCDVTRF